MAIEFINVSHTYAENTPFQYQALLDVSLNIPENEITAIIGETGSGKSTLVQHLNALLLPSKGTVKVLDKTIVANEKVKDLKAFRKKVGLVFQFPEYQLFEETILKDVSFGPKNFQMENVEECAKKALQMVGIDASYYERSPIELSGGQKRRVAIAGVLAMDPDIIVLDEPTAGLDPSGSESMMKLFKILNEKYHKTIVLVTHDMEHVLEYCQNVIVMEKGKVALSTSVHHFFETPSEYERLNIVPPKLVQFKQSLIEKGFQFSNTLDLKQLCLEIKRQVNHE